MYNPRAKGGGESGFGCDGVFEVCRFAVPIGDAFAGIGGVGGLPSARFGGGPGDFFAPGDAFLFAAEGLVLASAFPGSSGKFSVVFSIEPLGGLAGADF